MNQPPILPGPSGGPTDWSVVIEEKGRYGTVHYRESGGTLSLSWEFGGNDVVAFISIESEAIWRTRYPWTAGRRAEILKRIAAEVIRQRAPRCHAEIDDRAGWINIREGAPPPAVPTPPRLTPPVFVPPPLNPHSAFRERKAKIVTILAIIVLVVAAGAVAFKTMFSVKSGGGNPLGLSVRTPEHIATLIQTLEPYIPTLHRNPANDRYRLALALYPVDGRSPARQITLVTQRPVSEFNLVKLLGCDGTTVWFDLNRIGGVNLKSGKVIGVAELRRANPSLDESVFNPRLMECGQRLRMESADRQRIYEVIPETLQAVPVQTKRNAARSPFEPRLEEFLSAGARPSPAEWLGVISTNDAKGHYKLNSWLYPINRAEDRKELRSLYRAQLGPELERGNREILTLDRISDDEYLNAAFVRAAPEADPLRLSGPDGFLMIYTAKPGLGGTMVLARVDASGKILWKTDTGIDRFKLSQILPDTRFIAFTGTPPAIPDKLPPPLLVIVDTQSGAASTISLWQ